MSETEDSNKNKNAVAAGNTDAIANDGKSDTDTDNDTDTVLWGKILNESMNFACCHSLLMKNDQGQLENAPFSIKPAPVRLSYLFQGTQFWRLPSMIE